MTKLEIETNIETTVNGTEKIIIQTNINIIRIFFDTYAVCTTIGASFKKIVKKPHYYLHIS